MGKIDLIIFAASAITLAVGSSLGFGRGSKPDDIPPVVSVQIEQRALSEAVAKQALEIEQLKREIEVLK